MSLTEIPPDSTPDHNGRRDPDPNARLAPTPAKEHSYWLWIDAQQVGPYPVDVIYKMGFAGFVDGETQYFDDAAQTWRPLVALMRGVRWQQSLSAFAQGGVEHCQTLPSGFADCAACHKLTRKKFTISEPPQMPPEGCTCRPWCRCTLIPVP